MYRATRSATAVTGVRDRVLGDPRVPGGTAVRRVTHTPREVPAWQPTRFTSPYCVLSAAGLQDDYYTSCLSWGRSTIGLALREYLVVFHPRQTHQMSWHACFSRSSEAAEADPGSSAPRVKQPSAVAITRFNDAACFLGLADGAVELYEGREGTQTLCSALAFDMPSPPLERLRGFLHGGSMDANGTPQASSASASAPAGPSGASATALHRLEQLLVEKASSVSAVGCLTTSALHPWLAVAGTASRGLLAVDARQRAPCLHFGDLSDDLLLSGRVPTWSSSSSSSSLSGGGGVGSQHTRLEPTAAGPPLSTAQRLKSVATFLRSRDRLASVAWNAAGSLVATGGGDGVVAVWSVSNTRAPLHTILIEPHSTVKALAFHPARPYELVVGTEAGPSGVRVYNVSSAAPALCWSTPTRSQTTQALYSPDGEYILTSHGAAEDTGEPNAPRLSRTTPYASSEQLSSPSPSSSSAPVAAVAAAPLPPLADGMGVDREYASIEELHGLSYSSTQPQSSQWALGGPLHVVKPWRAEGGLQDAPFPPWYATAGYPRGHGRDTADAESAVDSGRGPERAAAIPPFSLVVWKRGSKQREDYLRDAVLGEQERPRGGGDSTDGNSSSSSSSPNARPQPLLVQSVFPGHRSRPLCLCTPFPQSASVGSAASVAAGRDGTVRFWQIFGRASAGLRRDGERTSATLSAAASTDAFEEGEWDTTPLR